MLTPARFNPVPAVLQLIEAANQPKPMTRKSLKDVLMKRDGLSSEEADAQIKEAREELLQRIKDGDCPMDICEEFFGLEPDYLDELLLGS